MSSNVDLHEEWVLVWTDLEDLEKDEGLPPGTFPAGCRLAARSAPLLAYNLSWSNVAGEPCSMTLFEKEGKFQRSDFHLHLGSQEFYCQAVQIEQVVSNVSDGCVLVGFLKAGTGATGNAGTFVAQANPDPPNGEGCS